ncbi:SDR family NAD(P)-dependent oxidoreductase [Streptomyces sp. MA5143a]|uniref:SDR family NAD(P)-dependent oxidoreductase n=1 Tax=Streptomyces sp. MA5143a TaxID=2083010 RepID=UPI000D1AE036|nr:SDR family NAD(P)-dependent oxidoreductase [Streptomyces sp. MA5143a]SPF02717.1 Polyketide synthase PksL [Streptomyces sp. MA5143a]
MTQRAETYEKTFAGREPLIAQHRAAGTGLLPAAAQLEMAMVGVARLGPFAPLELTDVTFLRPLTLADDATAAVRLDVVHDPDTRFELSTVTAGERKQLSTGGGRPLPYGTPTGAVPRITVRRSITPDDLYAGWSRAGLRYGPDFRTVRELTVGEGTARAVLRSDAEPLPWFAHPLLTDGVFQVMSCALQDLDAATGPRPMLPIGVARVAVHTDLSALASGATVLARRTGVEGAYSTGDALVLGPSGEVAAEFTGIRMRGTTEAGRTAAPSGRTTRLVSRIHWRAVLAPARHAAQGTWVVLHHGDDLGRRTAGRLRADGARVVEVGLGTPAAARPYEAAGALRDDRLVLAHTDEDAFRRLWEDIGNPVAGVVHLWNAGTTDGDREDEDAELGAGLYGCFAALKTLGERQRGSRFLVVTRHAQPVGHDDVPVPARAALWGLVRTAAIEYPGLRPRLVDLDDTSDDAVMAELGDGPTETGGGTAATDDGPTEVGYRNGVRHEPARVFDTQAGSPAARPVRRGGRYLVLGGHGGLGLEVTRRFAAEGAGLVALVSRTGRPGADHPHPVGTGPAGCTVVSYAADVTAPGELRAVVERIRDEHGELHGVIHAAGTLKDGLIRSTTAEDMTAVLRPKVSGVRELAAAVAGTELDFAVLFASVSGTFGNLGQGGYAAANAYLDAFAHARGAPWLSVDWGLWGEVGMGTAVADQLRRRGVRPLGTAEALDALIAVLGGDARQVVVAHPDASEAGPDGDEANATAVPRPSAGAGTGDLDAVHVAEGRERVEDALERFLAERLGVSPFDRRAPLADYGMSSIMSVELSEELSRRWGLHLPATLFLEHGDFADLAQALTDRYGAAGAVAPPAADATPEPTDLTARDARPKEAEPVAEDVRTPEPTSGSAGRPRRAAGGAGPDIAVVAVSGDLPGAPDVADLWPLLRSGGHAFTEIPAERWDIDAHFEARGSHMTGTYCRTGAFLDDIDRFDPSFFGISVREAEEMDAQQKLLLEHAWAVRDESGLAGRRDIGVFVGATYTHHRDAHGLDTVGPHTALGSLNAVLANRVSYALDLTGPSQTVDTLCSSSLVAVQQAVAALRSGTCGAAIVAACHVGLTPWYYRSLSQLGALSETLPRPFDERADGFVPGEGVIAVMLRPLEDAERDGDTVWGVIRGTAVNHGGRGSALPVPRSEAQSAVIRAALDDAGAAPADISLIETHGTATRLGDPIEIAALTEVFGTDPDRRTPLHLGSVKANIGHLEPASGLAGLVKVLLCLRHGEIPPLAGHETPGTHLDLTGGPFVIPARRTPWHSDAPRRAGISAFGMGGTNAHIVVEEYAAPPAPDAPAQAPLGEYLLPLSAHTSEALVRRAADLERALRAEPSAAGALCRSAAVGRDHLRHRAVVLGTTADSLLAGLARIARGDREVLGDRAIHRGEESLRGEEILGEGESRGIVLRDGTALVGAERPADAALAARLAPLTSHTPDRIAARLTLPENRLSTALAFFHVGGGTVDWRQVYEGAPTRRVALPPYPFRAETAVAPATRTETTGRGARQDTADVPGIVQRLSRAHRVFGEDTLPGALTLALALRNADVLRRVAFVSRGTGSHPLRSDLSDLDGPTRTGPVTFRHGGRIVARLETGRADEVPADTFGDHDIDALRAGLDRTLEPTGLYAWFAAKGMDFAAPLRSLTEVRFGAARVLARVDVPSGDALERAAVALDAALQSMAVLTLADPAAASAAYLPASVGRVVRLDDPARATHVLLDADETTPDGVRRGHAALLSAEGRVLARLEDVEYRTVAAGVRQAVNGAAVTTPSPLPAAGAGIEAAVLAVVRNVLHDPSVTPTTSLSSAGLDSMLATAVAAEIEEKHGVRLSPTDVLDAADCRALAAHVAEQTEALQPTTAVTAPTVSAAPAGEPYPDPAPELTPEPAHHPKDMAVIGLALALPGARNPEELWRLLIRGDSEIGAAPAHRWGTYAQGSASDLGGFLDDVEDFDARFFDFFPKQAEVLDPQARWLLRTTWEALESAGLPPRRLRPSTGVFVGASYQHYRDYNIPPELDAHTGLGNHNAFLANRLSHFLDLRGPSMTVDTLCSSSLVALHTAVRSIGNGECEQAIVAGVRVAMSPLHYVAMRNLRALSASGASRAFDAAADGFVPGEGVVSVVVKPLAAALRDGDRVRGVIRGSAVNHGGRTSGLTVPSARGQGEVVAEALRDAGVSPETIGLLEAHGTGTSLGDPIEVEGLTRAWREHTDRAQFCAIGSLKSNVGHLEPAAGLAGLVKALLAMEHGMIPPTLHVTRPNDHIRFEDTPFYLADRPRPWPRDGQPRRAAVSAFGMGGVNAHVVVEEPPPAPARTGTVHGPHLVRVTAADEPTVRTLAAAYADRFDAAHDERETADLCHTANVGRSPLEYQTAVSGCDAAELAAALRSVAAGELPVARVDSALTAEQALGGTVAAGEPHRHTAVVAMVRAGYAHVEWARLSAPGARVTDLPTYPFAARKHWHTREATPPSSPDGTASAAATAGIVVTAHGTAAAAGGGPEALRVDWHPSELPLVGARPPRGSVRLVTADTALRAALTALLREEGAIVEETGLGADTVVVVNPPDGQTAEPADLSAFWSELGSLVKALPAHGRLLWAGHHGAAVHGPAVHGAENAPSERARLRPEAAAMAVAVRAACAESRKPCAVVDLDPADPADVRARQIAAEYTALFQGRDADPGTDLLPGTTAAYRRGVRYTPRTAAAPPGPSYRPTNDGYYLVTGGLGAVGRYLIRRLVDGGARHIGVIGRSVLDETRAARLRKAAQGAEAAYLPCDVVDASALAAAAREFGARWGRLLGVVHCSGGVNPFGAMHRRPWSDAARVIAPKVPGSLNAVRLAQEEGADFAVLVSSVAGAQPRAGRGLVDYSLANAYQLALAERENGPVTAVTAHAWPNWTGTGMEADASYSAAHSLAADEAADAFLTHITSGGAVVFPGTASTATPPQAPPAPAVPAAPPATREAARSRAYDEVAEIRTVIAARPAGGRNHDQMRGHVRDAFVHVLGEDPGDRPLQALGLDSLVIAELTAALERCSGLTVDPSLLMRAPTAAEVAAGLAAAPESSPAPAEDTPPTGPAAADDRRVSVAGDGRRVSAAVDEQRVSALSALLHPLLTRDRNR